MRGRGVGLVASAVTSASLSTGDALVVLLLETKNVVNLIKYPS